MRSGKKRNPREMVPLIQLERERKKITNEAIRYAFMVMFMVMHDKEKWGQKRLERLFNEICYLSDSINKGYVKVEDIKRTLEEELEIKFIEEEDYVR